MERIAGWLEEKNIIPFTQRTGTIDTQFLERMVRVVEELKRQNKKSVRIDEKFEHMKEKSDL